MSAHGRMDGQTDGNASKTVYPPVSLRSLGGYKIQPNTKTKTTPTVNGGAFRESVAGVVMWTILAQHEFPTDNDCGSGRYKPWQQQI